MGQYLSLPVPNQRKVSSAGMRSSFLNLYPCIENKNPQNTVAVVNAKHGVVIRVGDALQLRGPNGRRKDSLKAVAKTLPFQSSNGEWVFEVYWLYHREELDASLHDIVPENPKTKRSLWFCPDFPEVQPVAAIENTLLATVPALYDAGEHTHIIAGVYMSRTKQIAEWPVAQLKAYIPHYTGYLLQSVISYEKERRRCRVQNRVYNHISNKLTAKAADGGDLKAMSYSLDISFDDLVCLGKDFAAVFQLHDSKLVAIVDKPVHLKLLSGHESWSFSHKYASPLLLLMLLSMAAIIG
jgi:hypothetical protein